MSEANRLLVFGATSAIAQAAAGVMAKRGTHRYLVDRRKERLERVAADLRARRRSWPSPHGLMRLH